VNVDTVISTSGDQLAIAPGSLLRQWQQGGRNYYEYKLDHFALNFYSFLSASYMVERQKWNGIDVEVYYLKEHPWNVPKMVNSVEKSFSYYTTNFGPYYNKQARIIEFPRVSSYAQEPCLIPNPLDLSRALKSPTISIWFITLLHTRWRTNGGRTRWWAQTWKERLPCQKRLRSIRR
jgi:hypothetical protein